MSRRFLQVPYGRGKPTQLPLRSRIRFHAPRRQTAWVLNSSGLAAVSVGRILATMVALVERTVISGHSTSRSRTRKPSPRSSWIMSPRKHGYSPTKVASTAARRSVLRFLETVNHSAKGYHAWISRDARQSPRMAVRGDFISITSLDENCACHF
jgi:hypothetical protein